MNLGELTRELQKQLAMHGPDTKVSLSMWVSGKRVVRELTMLVPVDEKFPFITMVGKNGIPKTQTKTNG